MISNTLRVLVVDGDELARAELATMLGRAGCFADTVGNAESALACLCTERYDVVWMDVFLPKINGEEFLLTIKSNYPNVLILVASLEDSQPVIQRLFRLGACAYLMKPLNETDVRRVIAQVRGSMFSPGQGQASVLDSMIITR